MGSWHFQRDGWATPLVISVNYWPNPAVSNDLRGSDNDHVGHFENLIQASNTAATKNVPSIILGDFNSQLGTQQESFLAEAQKADWGTRIGAQMNRLPNQTETRLMQIINNQRLVIASSRTKDNPGSAQSQYTYFKAKSTYKSLIDYVMIPENHMHLLRTCSTLRNSHTLLQTDHDVIQTVLALEANPRTLEDHIQPTLGKDFNIRLLAKPEKSKEYKNNLEKRKRAFFALVDRFAKNAPTSPTKEQKSRLANLLLRELTQVFTKAAEETLGTHTTGLPPKAWQSQHPPPRVHDEEFLALKLQRSLAVKALENAEQKQDSAENISKLQTDVRKAHQKYIHRHSTILHAQSIDSLKDFSLDHNSQINTPSGNYSGSIWAYIQQIKKQQDPVLALPRRMKNLLGKMQTTDEASAKCWHESRQKISGKQDNTTSSFFRTLWASLSLKEEENEHQNRMSDLGNDLPFNKDLSVVEIEWIIKHLRTGVSPGQDNIHNSLLVHGGFISAALIHKAFAEIWKLEQHPEDWNFCKMRMIFKHGDIYLAENYRGIVLISTLCKVYESVLKNRIQDLLSSQNSLSHLQHGYKENASSTEAVYTLTQLIQRRKLVEKKPTYCAFIDFVTAFPTVCRPSLWDAVHSKGITGKTWRILHELYAKPVCQVIHPDITDTFHIQKGLREGSRLSPLLYTIYVDTLIKKLEQSKLGAYADGSLNNSLFKQWMGAIFYADDIVLIADDPDQLQRMLDIVQTWAQENYAQISLRKTFVMSFHVDPSAPPQQTSTHEWKITDTTSDTPVTHIIKQCTTFTYLGVLLDQTLTFHEATKQAIASFWFAHRKIQDYGAHKHGLSPFLISYLWKSMVLSKLTNTLPFIHDKKDLAKIQEAIHKSIKHLISPNSTRRSFLPIPVCSDMGIPSAELLQTLLLARFHAHLNVISHDRPASIIHRMQKHSIIAQGPSNYTHSYRQAIPPPQLFDASIKMALDILQLSNQWTNIDFPPPPNNVHKYSPQKKERSWIQQTVHPALLSLQQLRYQQWTNTPKHSNPEGRNFTYHHHTATDHLRTMRHKKDIFSPAPYLKYSSSSIASMSLLRLRTQISVLPTHQPYQNDIDSPNPYTHTEYAFRYCPHPSCLGQIPQPWGNLHPMRGLPAGNEPHYVLHCPKYQDIRRQCNIAMDEELSMLHHGLPNKQYPWSSLPDDEKVASLLAATPPPTWNLSKKTEILWLKSSAPIIYNFWRPIIAEFAQQLRNTDIETLPFQCNPHAVTPT